MIRKGIQFRLDRMLIFREGSQSGMYNAGKRKGEAIPGNYVTILRVFPLYDWQSEKDVPAGYKKDDILNEQLRQGPPCNWIWYSKQVTITGHSRTNMPYGEEFVAEDKNFDKRRWRRVYWVEDGHVYIGRYRVDK
jgi:hypothetical protein